MENNKNKGGFLFFFGLLMVVTYLGLSYLLIFSPMMDGYNRILRIVLGVLLFFYGLFRAYRMWKINK